MDNVGLLQGGITVDDDVDNVGIQGAIVAVDNVGLQGTIVVDDVDNVGIVVDVDVDMLAFCNQDINSTIFLCNK